MAGPSWAEASSDSSRLMREAHSCNSREERLRILEEAPSVAAFVDAAELTVRVGPLPNSR
jgi:hypothetical protein